MHIECGDNRQYFQQQAGKNFAGDVANLINEGLNTSVSITQKANESTLANNQIQLANDFYKKNKEINTTIMSNSNCSTALHELGHLFLNGLNELAKVNENAQKQLEDVNNIKYSKVTYIILKVENSLK